MISRVASMLVLGFLPWHSGQQIRDVRQDIFTNRSTPKISASFIYDLSCEFNKDCIENAYCEEDSLCECFDGYTLSYDTHTSQVTCNQCPRVHESCTTCCYPPGFTSCHNNVCRCVDDYNSSECSDMDQFKLATQIALGSALIIGVACLLAVLWGTCRRRNEIARRLASRGAVRRDDDTASLTSTQRLVQERLRHRPPDYHDRRHIRIEKPPTYQESVEQPLRYPILNLHGPVTTLTVLPPPEPEVIEMTVVTSPVEAQTMHIEETANSSLILEDGIDIGRANPTFLISDEKDGILEINEIKDKEGNEVTLHM